jgi:predicted SprT family Zn-dependent metalloprotease
MNNKYTKIFYDNLQTAYDYFNQELFQNELPQCVITLNRKTNTLGYYKKNAFTTNSGNENISEIALNPDHFNRPIKEILSTLVHEQAHLLCDVRGYVSRRGFHSKQWVEIMCDQCGLQPISLKNGEDVNEGAAKLSHRIIEGDLFDMVCDKLLKEITFDLTNIVEIKEKKEKKVTKFTYICPDCGEEAILKRDDFNLICGDCSVQMKVETQ